MKLAKVTAKVVKRVNPELMDRLTDSVKNLRRVVVGIPAGTTHSSEDGSFPTAAIAAVHEYGAPEVGIPERPWLRNTIRKNFENYRRLNRINVIKVLQGKMGAEQALELLGMMAKAHVQQFIYTNTYTLKQSTVDAKGSSRALVDTGQFVQSINYQVLKEGQ